MLAKDRNLMSLMSVVTFLPKGLFIDNIAKHMEIFACQGQEFDVPVVVVTFLPKGLFIENIAKHMEIFACQG